MAGSLSISTDQLEALVELHRQGSLRAAARTLFVSEQGLRNRLIALERRVGAELYRKQRGVRRGMLLTDAGRKLLPQAESVLDQVRRMGHLLRPEMAGRAVHVAATQYLTYYLLVDVIRRFHQAEPAIRVRLSVRTEQEIESELRRDPTLVMGLTAPYEAAPELTYEHVFSVGWGLIVPRGHRLAGRKLVRLADVAAEPMILFERGSTGRQHVLDAFAAAGLSPRVEMEATHTQVIVRMVGAGLGVSIVPLLPDGSVTRGQRVQVCAMDAPITPIRSGILTRRGERLPEGAQRLVQFLRSDHRVGALG